VNGGIDTPQPSAAFVNLQQPLPRRLALAASATAFPGLAPLLPGRGHREVADPQLLG
jgi:hypothetical protein